MQYSGDNGIGLVGHVFGSGSLGTGGTYTVADQTGPTPYVARLDSDTLDVTVSYFLDGATGPFSGTGSGGLTSLAMQGANIYVAGFTNKNMTVSTEIPFVVNSANSNPQGLFALKYDADTLTFMA